MKTSRVGQVTAPGKVSFLTREVAPPKPTQVIVQVRASAICGSDLHIFKGKHPSVALPATIGHEFSGDVVAVGSAVSHVKIGDKVTVEPCIVCGTCDACRQGNYSYCESISFTYRNGDGSMADYVTVEQNYVYPFPEHLTYQTAALIEPMSVATHAVRRADIKLGESVLILGAGAIGLMVCALCKLSGAQRILVSDFAPARLELAKKLGATDVVNPAKGVSLKETVHRHTNGMGVDKSFECVGREYTLVQAMEMLRKNGLCTVVGIFEEPLATIPATRFVTHEIRVQGSQGYCWDFPIALETSKSIDLSSFITHTFQLDHLQQAIETNLDPQMNSIKVIIEP